MKSSISITEGHSQAGKSHPVFRQVLATVQEHELLLDTDAPLVALVSGGCDSTALAYLLKTCADAGKISFHNVRIVHINHCLRGEASEEDARFVDQLASSLGFACEVVVVDVQGHRERQGGSLEAVARTLRYDAAYEALGRLCYERNCPVSDGRILTAHTLNDRVETYFMRSIVGTGPGGLASIPYRNGSVVRPLLDCLRVDIEEYVRAVAGDDKQLWREDASNTCTDFFRNYVRHEIIPRALTQNPSLHQTLRHTMNLIADEDELLTKEVTILIDQIVEYDPSMEPGVLVALRADRLFVQPLPLQRRLLYEVLKNVVPAGQRLESQHIADIILRGNRSGFAIDLPGSIRVRNEYGTLLVFPLETKEDPRQMKKACNKDAFLLLRDLSFESVVVPEGESPVVYARAHADALCVFVDAEKLLSACRGDLNTLELRRVKPGEAFCPLGMGSRHKKVQDILVDRKISSRRRSGQMILLAGGTPVWLIGIMLDNRFKADESPLLMCIRFRDTVQAYGSENHI